MPRNKQSDASHPPRATEVPAAATACQASNEQRNDAAHSKCCGDAPAGPAHQSFSPHSARSMRLIDAVTEAEAIAQGTKKAAAPVCEELANAQSVSPRSPSVERTHGQSSKEASHPPMSASPRLSPTKAHHCRHYHRVLLLLLLRNISHSRARDEEEERDEPAVKDNDTLEPGTVRGLLGPSTTEATPNLVHVPCVYSEHDGKRASLYAGALNSRAPQSAADIEEEIADDTAISPEVWDGTAFQPLVAHTLTLPNGGCLTVYTVAEAIAASTVAREDLPHLTAMMTSALDRLASGHLVEGCRDHCQRVRAAWPSPAITADAASHGAKKEGDRRTLDETDNRTENVDPWAFCRDLWSFLRSVLPSGAPTSPPATHTSALHAGGVLLHLLWSLAACGRVGRLASRSLADALRAAPTIRDMACLCVRLAAHESATHSRSGKEGEMGSAAKTVGNDTSVTGAEPGWVWSAVESTAAVNSAVDDHHKDKYDNDKEPDPGVFIRSVELLLSNAYDDAIEAHEMENGGGERDTTKATTHRTLPTQLAYLTQLRLARVVIACANGHADASTHAIDDFVEELRTRVLPSASAAVADPLLFSAIRQELAVVENLLPPRVFHTLLLHAAVYELEWFVEEGRAGDLVVGSTVTVPPTSLWTIYCQYASQLRTFSPSASKSLGDNIAAPSAAVGTDADLMSQPYLQLLTIVFAHQMVSCERHVNSHSVVSEASAVRALEAMTDMEKAGLVRRTTKMFAEVCGTSPWATDLSTWLFSHTPLADSLLGFSVGANGHTPHTATAVLLMEALVGYLTGCPDENVLGSPGVVDALLTAVENAHPSHAAIMAVFPPELEMRGPQDPAWIEWESVITRVAKRDRSTNNNASDKASTVAPMTAAAKATAKRLWAVIRAFRPTTMPGLFLRVYRIVQVNPTGPPLQDVDEECAAIEQLVTQSLEPRSAASEEMELVLERLASEYHRQPGRFVRRMTDKAGSDDDGTNSKAICPRDVMEMCLGFDWHRRLRSLSAPPSKTYSFSDAQSTLNALVCRVTGMNSHQRQCRAFDVGHRDDEACYTLCGYGATQAGMALLQELLGERAATSDRGREATGHNDDWTSYYARALILAENTILVVRKVLSEVVQLEKITRREVAVLHAGISSSKAAHFEETRDDGATLSEVAATAAMGAASATTIAFTNATAPANGATAAAANLIRMVLRQDADEAKACESREAVFTRCIAEYEQLCTTQESLIRSERAKWVTLAALPCFCAERAQSITAHFVCPVDVVLQKELPSAFVRDVPGLIARVIDTEVIKLLAVFTTIAESVFATAVALRIDNALLLESQPMDAAGTKAHLRSLRDETLDAVSSDLRSKLSACGSESRDWIRDTLGPLLVPATITTSGSRSSRTAQSANVTEEASVTIGTVVRHELRALNTLLAECENCGRTLEGWRIAEEMQLFAERVLWVRLMQRDFDVILRGEAWHDGNRALQASVRLPVCALYAAAYGKASDTPAMAALQSTVDEFEAALCDARDFPVGCFVDLERLAELSACRSTYTAIMVQQDTMTSAEVTLFREWERLLAVFDTIRSTNSMRMVLAAHRGDWAGLRHLAAHLDGARHMLHENRHLVHALQMAKRLHNARVKLTCSTAIRHTFHFHEEGSRTLVLWVSAEYEGVIYHQEDILRVEEQLVNHGHIACTAEDATWVAEDAKEADSDRTAAAFLFACAQWREVQRKCRALVDEAAATVEETLEIVPRDSLRFGRDVDGVQQVLQLLEERLQAWQRRVSVARRTHPMLWLLTAEQTRQARDLLLRPPRRPEWSQGAGKSAPPGGGGGKSDDEPNKANCDVLLAAWVKWVCHVVPQRTRTDAEREILAAVVKHTLSSLPQPLSTTNWLDTLGAVMDAMTRTSFFERNVWPAPPSSMVEPFLLSMLAGEQGMTRCMIIDASGTPHSRADMLLWCLCAYVANIHRLPHAFEVLVCTSATTEEDVQRFLSRWSALSCSTSAGSGGQRLFCFAIVYTESLSMDVLDALRRGYAEAETRAARNDELLATTTTAAAAAAVTDAGEQDTAEKAVEARGSTAIPMHATRHGAASARANVLPTLLILVGTRAGTMAGARTRSGNATTLCSLGTLGTAACLSAASFAAMKPLLAYMKESPSFLGSQRSVRLLTGHAASRFCDGGGDAAAWLMRSGPQAPHSLGQFAVGTSAEHGCCHDKGQYYIRCELSTEAATCRVLAAAKQQCPGGASLNVRLDVNPFCDPAEMNRALFSLLVWGLLRSDGADTFSPTEMDSIVIVVPPPVQELRQLQHASASKRAEIGESVDATDRIPVRYTSADDCIARELLPHLELPRRVSTYALKQQVVCTVSPQAASHEIARWEEPLSPRRAVTPPCSGELLLTKTVCEPDRMGKRVMQAILFALGCREGCVPHFPLPDALSRFIDDAQAPLVYFSASVVSCHPKHVAVRASDLPPEAVFALLWRLLDASESFASRGARNEAEMVKGTAIPTPLWVPTHITEEQIERVFRFYEQLRLAVDGTLHRSDYRNLICDLEEDGTTALVGPASLESYRSYQWMCELPADPRIAAMKRTGLRARQLRVLQSITDAIGYTIDRCAALCRRTPLPLDDHSHLLLKGLEGGAQAEERKEESDVPDLQGWLQLAAVRGHMLTRATDATAQHLDMIPFSSMDKQGAAVDTFIARLLTDPLLLLEHTAVSKNVGQQLLLVADRLAEAAAERNVESKMPDEAVCKSALAVGAICQRVRSDPVTSAEAAAREAARTGQTEMPLSPLDELRKDVLAYHRHVSDGTIAEWLASRWATPSVAARSTRRNGTPPFTRTPYLVQMMLHVSTQWHAAEPVIIVGAPGTGKSRFASYCAAMSGLPFRRLTCDRTLSAGDFKARVATMIADMDEAWARSRKAVSTVLRPDAHTTLTANDEDRGARAAKRNHGNDNGSSTSTSTSKTKEVPSDDVARCVVVLDDINRMLHPWAVKQVLLDRMFPGVRFIATMVPHEAEGAGNEPALTVPLARELRPMLQPFAPPSERRVSQHLMEIASRLATRPLSLPMPAATITDEHLMTHAAAQYVVSECRWAAPSGNGSPVKSLVELLCTDDVSVCTNALISTLDELLAAAREAATATGAATARGETVASCPAAVLPSLGIVWSWVEAFLFFVTLSLRVRAANAASPTRGVAQTHAEEEGDGLRLLTCVYGATLISRALSLPAAARHRLVAPALRMLCSRADTGAVSFITDVRRIVKQCVRFPPGVHAGDRMTEMTMALQLTAFSDSYMPCFLHGPPGAGKTLSLACVEWATGAYREGHALLQGLPYTRCRRRRIRCSEDTHPAQIEVVAREVARADWLRAQGSGHFSDGDVKSVRGTPDADVTVLELDEVGLMVGGPYEAQAVLRRLIDEGVYLPETGKYHPIRIVCVSNTYLDASTMSRFLVVDSLQPDVADYVGTAAALSSALPLPLRKLVDWAGFFRLAAAWADAGNLARGTAEAHTGTARHRSIGYRYAGGGATASPSHRDLFAVVKTTLYLLVAASRVRHDHGNKSKVNSTCGDDGGGGDFAELTVRDVHHAVFAALALNIGVCGDNESWAPDFQALACAAVGVTGAAASTEPAAPATSAGERLPQRPASWMCQELSRDHDDKDGATPLCATCIVLASMGGSSSHGRVPLCASVDFDKPETGKRESWETTDECERPFCAQSYNSIHSSLALFVGLATRAPTLRIHDGGTTITSGSAFALRLRHPMWVGSLTHAWHLAHLLGLVGTPQSQPVETVLGRQNARASEDLSRDMARAKVAIREGKRLILFGAAHLCHYLSDLLNPNDDEEGDYAHAMLNHAGNSEWVRVHDDFRVLAMVSPEEYAALEGPVQSRFCTLRVSYDMVMPSRVVRRVDDWYHGFDLRSMDRKEGKEETANPATHATDADDAGVNMLAYLIPGLTLGTVSALAVCLYRRSGSSTVTVSAKRESTNGEEIVDWVRVLAFAVSPTRYLYLSGVPTTPLRGGTVADLLNLFPDAYKHKDDLSSAFCAYVAMARKQGLAAPRHALVLTSQQAQPLSLPHHATGDGHVQMLARAWAATVASMLEASKNDEKGDEDKSNGAKASAPSSAPARVHAGFAYDVTRMSPARVQETLASLARHLRTVCGNVTKLPVVFCMYEPAMPNSRTSAAWQLPRLSVALEESGLLRDPRLHMAIVVMLHPTRLFVPPPQPQRHDAVGENAAPAGDESPPWGYMSLDWAVLHVDEVCGCGDCLQTGASDARGSERVHMDGKDAASSTASLFTLAEILGRVPQSPALLLSRSRALLQSLLRASSVLLAQELTEFRGSLEEVSAWLEGLRTLFGTEERRSGIGRHERGVNPLGEVITAYMQRACEQHTELHRLHASARIQARSTDDRDRVRATAPAMSALDRETLLCIGSGATAGKTPTMANAAAMAMREPTLRSRVLRRTERVALNVAVHVIGLLFASPQALMEACRTATGPDALPCALASFLLMQCGPDGGPLPLCARTTMPARRVLTIAAVRERQPFLCRQGPDARAACSGSPSSSPPTRPVAARLPFSYPTYRLLREAAEALEDSRGAHGAHSTENGHMVPTELAEVLRRVSTPAHVELYVRDCLVYFLEAYMTVTESNTSDAVLWCLVVLVDLHAREGQGQSYRRVGNDSRSDSDDRWADMVSASSFLCALFASHAKWLAHAHAYCALSVKANRTYVGRLQRMCPRATLAGKQKLFASTTAFYQCVTFSEPIHGAMVTDTPTESGGEQEETTSPNSSPPSAPLPQRLPPSPVARLRATPQELVRLRALSANDAAVRFRIDAQRLSYAMCLNSLDDEPVGVSSVTSATTADGRSRDRGVAAVEAQKQEITRSFLCSATDSSAQMCDWLLTLLQSLSSRPPAVREWVTHEVVPLVVLQLRLSAAPIAANVHRPFDDVLPRQDAVASRLVLAVLTARTGALACPASAALSLARSAFRRWCTATEADTIAAAAGNAGNPTGAIEAPALAAAAAAEFPLACLAPALAGNLEGDLAIVIVTAVVHELRAFRTPGDGDYLAEGSEAQAANATGMKDEPTRAYAARAPPPPAASRERGAKVRVRLWQRIVAAWRAQHEHGHATFYHLALCLAVGLLQVEMEVTMDAVHSVARGLKSAAPAAASRAVLAALARKLFRFQQEWFTVVASAGVTAVAADETQLRYAIYVLALRVFSSNGFDTAGARDLLTQLLAAAPRKARPSFAESVLMTGIVSQRERRSVLSVLLSDRFVLGPGEKLPAAVKVTLMHIVTCFSTNTPPEDALGKTEMGRFTREFLRWRADACERMPHAWRDDETQSCLAALGLYILTGGSVTGGGAGGGGGGGGIDPSASPSYALRVMRGGATVEFSLTDVAAMRYGANVSVDPKADALAHAARAVAAFTGCILQGSRPHPSSEREQGLIDDLVLAALPSCPRCHNVFDNFTGCCALTCRCGTTFCAWCLNVFGDSNVIHDHVLKCPLSRAKNNHFAQLHLWFAAYVENVFPARLEALTVQKALQCTVSGRTARFFRNLSPPETAVLTAITPATMERIRYRAFGAVARLGYSLGVDPRLIWNALSAAAVAEAADRNNRLRAVRANTFDVCCEVLDDSIEQVKTVFFYGAKVTHRVVLKFLLAYVSSVRLNCESRQLTPELLLSLPRGKVTDTNRLVADLDADMAAHGDAGASELLQSTAAWDRVYQEAVDSAQRAGQRGARLPLLFATTHGRVEDDTADALTESLLRAVELSESIGTLIPDSKLTASTSFTAATTTRGLGAQLRRLHTLRHSFSPRTAAALSCVLGFALDARRVARRHFVSVTVLRRTKLSYLTEKHFRMFPEVRVREFIVAARELLSVLDRADNQCHEQHFTIADTENASDIDLSEAVLLDDGGLLNVLYTGTNAIGDAEATSVGYGNAQDGQTRVLDGLGAPRWIAEDDATAAAADEGSNRSTASSAFLLDASTDLIQYDPQLLPLLAKLVHPDAGAQTQGNSRTPHFAAAAGSTATATPFSFASRASRGTSAVVRHALLCADGLFARPALPAALPEMELDTPGILAVLMQAMATLLAPFDLLAEGSDREADDDNGKSERESRAAMAVNWYTRMAATVRRLCERNGDTHNDGSASDASRSFQHNIFCFLVEYTRFASSVVRRHSYMDPMAQGTTATAAAGTTAGGTTQKPPPSFGLVSPQLLTAAQRQAQSALETANVGPEELPLLLIAAFDESFLTSEPAGATEATAHRAGGNRTPSAESSLASRGKTKDSEDRALEKTAAALEKLGPTCQPILLAVFKLIALNADVIGVKRDRPLVEAMHRVLDAESYGAAAFLADRVEPILTLASLGKLLARLKQNLELVSAA